MGLLSPLMKGTRVWTLEITDILDTPEERRKKVRNDSLVNYPIEPEEDSIG
jgi:hypothetical protein